MFVPKKIIFYQKTWQFRWWDQFHLKRKNIWMIYHWLKVQKSSRFLDFLKTIKIFAFNFSFHRHISAVACACGCRSDTAEQNKFKLQLYKDRQNSNVLISFGSGLWLFSQNLKKKSCFSSLCEGASTWLFWPSKLMYFAGRLVFA
jgi:hypothetical protein